MDLNNAQQNAQPIQQAPAQQTVNEQAMPQQPIAQPELQTPLQNITTPPQETSKNGSKKLILLIIIILLISGMAAYVIFANNRTKITQQNTANNSIIAIPTKTPVATSPTPATIEEINVASPDADLNGIEKDIQEL